MLVYFKTAGVVADCGASIVFSTCRCRHLATSTISSPGALGGALFVAESSTSM